MRHIELGINSEGSHPGAFSQGSNEVPARVSPVVSPNAVSELTRMPRAGVSASVFPRDEGGVVLLDRDTPRTSMTIQSGEDRMRGSFTTLAWRNNHDTVRNVLTTHPEIIKSMVDKGPLAFEPYVVAGKDITVDTIHLQNSTVPHLRDPQGLYRIRVDAAQGLIHLHDEAPVDAIGVDGEMAPRVLFDTEDTVPNLPMSIGSKEGFMYQSLPLTKQLPALGTAFADLGFSCEAENGYRTFPVPSEFVRRMDALREKDTTSGIYYPEVRSLPTGDINAQTYLESFAQSRFPFGAKDFMHYDHDIPSYHLAAYMAHGEMAMDVSALYSQAILDTEHALFSYAPLHQGIPFEGMEKMEKAAYVNDIFSTDLGTMDLHGKGRGIGMYSLIYNDIVNTLRLEGRLGDLQIVEWMQEKGLVRDYQDMQGEDLLQGLLAHAREQFLQPQT